MSRLEHRNPLPELADGWEGPAPGSRQTSRRMGDKEGIHYKGLISHWALGICSPTSEHLHKISAVVSPPLILCLGHEKLLGQSCPGGSECTEA